MDDIALLREYATRNSQAAFETLVSRHAGLVYSAALRQVRDPHLAEEVTHVVFIILAQKAERISNKTILTGWFFKTTRFTALAQMRTSANRQRYEKELRMQSTDRLDPPDPFWDQVSPLLDEALSALSERDRQAILLRFFENKSLGQVGLDLGMSEDTARKRVSRALEKLRGYFLKRGVGATTAIIASALAANSVQAAPVTLVKSIAGIATANGATAGVSTLTLVKGTLKFMAWTKATTAAVVVGSFLAITGTTTLVVTVVRDQRIQLWQTPWAQSDMLRRVPAQVRILPTRFSRFGGWGYDGEVLKKKKVLGIAASVRDIVEAAYETPKSRIIFPANLPDGHYDFIANIPEGSLGALQKEIQRKFGLVGKREVRRVGVLLLTLKDPKATGLKPTRGIGTPEDSNLSPGFCSIPNQPLTGLAELLETYFEMPVLDRSKQPARFDIQMRWDEQEAQRNPTGLKKALSDELGIELISSEESVEMLIVNKIK